MTQLASIRARLEQGPATTFQLYEASGALAVHSRVTELREQLHREGLTVLCKYIRTTEKGTRIYRYEITPLGDTLFEAEPVTESAVTGEVIGGEAA